MPTNMLLFLNARSKVNLILSFKRDENMQPIKGYLLVYQHKEQLTFKIKLNILPTIQICKISFNSLFFLQAVLRPVTSQQPLPLLNQRITTTMVLGPGQVSSYFISVGDKINEISLPLPQPHSRCSTRVAKYISCSLHYFL